MNQQEKTRRTQERIMAAAIAEFGSKNYDVASINAICSDNQISKGLIYHHFRSKDELYLKCVKSSCTRLIEYLDSQELETANVQQFIDGLILSRKNFFRDNPECGQILFNTMLQMPNHLSREIKEIRSEIDSYYSNCFHKIVRQLDLRDGITEESALEYLLMLGQMLNGYFQINLYQGSCNQALIENQDGKLSGLFDVLIYGIAEKKHADAKKF